MRATKAAVPCFFPAMKILTLLLAVSVTASIAAEKAAPEGRAKKAGLSYPPEFSGAQTVTYKTVGEMKLALCILDPAEHEAADVPPTIVFHGKADSTVPFATVEVFAAAMKKAGKRCEVAGFEGQQHGFFNFGRGDNAMFRETLAQADKFLASLGWISGEPTADTFFKTTK